MIVTKVQPDWRAIAATRRPTVLFLKWFVSMFLIVEDGEAELERHLK